MYSRIQCIPALYNIYFIYLSYQQEVPDCDILPDSKTNFPPIPWPWMLTADAHTDGIYKFVSKRCLNQMLIL